VQTESSSAEGLDDRVPGDLLASSKGRSWRDLLVQMYERRPIQDSLLIPSVPEPLIVWVMTGSAVVEERELGGKWTANEVSEGSFFLQTSPRPCELKWRTLASTPFRVMHLYVGLPLLRRAGVDVHGAESQFPRLREISGGVDPIITQHLTILRDELLQPRRQSAMLVQGIASALAVHLVRTYADERLRGSAIQTGLPAFKLQRVIAIMQTRIDQELDLSRLAEAVQLSDAHFSRCFKKSTGQSPSQYLIRLRMEHARRLLRESTESVLAVGLAVGYSSPSHFSQVFRKAVGVLPTEYRQQRG
jgi:AraC family transcriptional regulator